MKWRSFFIGLGVGVATTILVSETSKRTSTISADKVLTRVKDTFKKESKVDGSWIHMKPEDYKMMDYETKVYKGGISRRNGSDVEQLEFLADAYTGSIIDVYSI